MFKKQKYKQAQAVYFEGLIEIEDVIEGNPKARQIEELKNLEISLRLNCATTRIKLEYVGL